MNTISWAEILGAKKRSTISTHENVFSEENVSVDIQEIKHIQSNTGSQYLAKFRFKVILAFIPIGQTGFLMRKESPLLNTI